MKFIDALSGGQKAKLILCNLMANNFDILILDEPTRNLSPMTNPALREALIKYNGTIIAVSHDKTFLKEVCDRFYKLTNDKLEMVNGI